MSHRAPSEEENAQMRRDAISWLRFPFAVVVVFVHVYAGGFMVDGVVHGYDTFPLTEWIGYFKNAFLKGQSVTIYFFIAGYVFFLGGEMTRARYRQKLRNRVHSLLVPFLLWNIFAAIIRWISISDLSLSSFTDERGGWLRVIQSFQPQDILWSAASSDSAGFMEVLRHGWFPADVPLWFMGVLMLVAVTVPLLHRGMLRLGSATLVTFGVLWFVAIALQLSLLRQIFCGYFFFSLGGWLSSGGRDVVTLFRKYRSFILIAYPAVSLLMFWHSATQHYMWLWHAWEYLLSIRQAVGVPFFFTVALMMAERAEISPTTHGGLWTNSAFFIYAAHDPIIHTVMRLLSSVIRVDSGWSATFLMLTTLAVSVLGLVGVYALMRRFAPRILSPFAGGRV